MNTENTNPDVGQQPNPGAVAGAATEAANPNGQPATVQGSSDGQGNGGNDAGGDAGKQGGADGAGAEGKTDDGQDKSKDTPELTGAPEAYGDFALPEGFTLDGDRKDLALSLFRDSNLSQAGAQKYIDAFTKLVGEDEGVRAQAMEAAVQQQRDDWAKQAKTELGDKYDEAVGFARTAVQATNRPELIKAFDELGWGNHPELIRAFEFFGRSMRDSPIDGISTGGSAAPARSLEDRMYPTKP